MSRLIRSRARLLAADPRRLLTSAMRERKSRRRRAPRSDETRGWAAARRALPLSRRRRACASPPLARSRVVRRSSKQRGDSAPTITLQAAVWQRRLSAEYESLLVAFGQPEADRAFGLRGWGDQLSQRLEDFVQLLVVLAEGCFGLSLEVFKVSLDRGVRGRNASQLDECPHDRDVD